jgi:hypothetical protein
MNKPLITDEGAELRRPRCECLTVSRRAFEVATNDYRLENPQPRTECHGMRSEEATSLFACQPTPDWGPLDNQF